jgi:hypothetical protein
VEIRKCQQEVVIAATAVAHLQDNYCLLMLMKASQQIRNRVKIIWLRIKQDFTQHKTIKKRNHIYLTIFLTKQACVVSVSWTAIN